MFVCHYDLNVLIPLLYPLHYKVIKLHLHNVNGVNLVYIRDLLGHSSVTGTEIYSKSNPKMKDYYDGEEKEDLFEWFKHSIKS